MLAKGLVRPKLIVQQIGWICRTMADKSKLFESPDIADAYVKYRPTYGPDVYNTIVEFCKETETCDFSLAVDIGSGSGQSTLPLSKHFRQVMGVDVSESQVSNAPKHIPNVTFRVGPAEDLSFLEKNSVDLVTVAQALHWMDTEKLYAEVERVLKPGGAFVVFGYGLSTLDEPKAQETLNYLYKDVLGPYWTDGRQHVEEHYKSYSLPFSGWRRNDSLKIERTWTVDEFVGYLCSWSAFQNYLMANPMANTMPSVKHEFREAYAQGDMEPPREMKIVWPVFMLMGHKPASS
ncbi:putative methyltransferase DDB_G0268948 [Littorina saxatilis]|uniref:Methyltransferase type 11 domain-containing protein n=1 Tax=Littorina saxatilis TaxID=31220 RepID=A0AAN9FWC7_9CAEN